TADRLDAVDSALFYVRALATQHLSWEFAVTAALLLLVGLAARRVWRESDAPAVGPAAPPPGLTVLLGAAGVAPLVILALYHGKAARRAGMVLARIVLSLVLSAGQPAEPSRALPLVGALSVLLGVYALLDRATHWPFPGLTAVEVRTVDRALLDLA